MSQVNPTDQEQVSLWTPCVRCGARPHFWCKTSGGHPAARLHGGRTFAYDQGWGAGYQEAEKDHLSYLREMDTERVLDYHARVKAGKRW